MSERFDFDLDVALTAIKNSSEQQPNSNSVDPQTPDGDKRTAKTAKTAGRVGGSEIFEVKMKWISEEQAKSEAPRGVVAVSAVSAVRRTGWQNLEQCSCCSPAVCCCSVAKDRVNLRFDLEATLNDFLSRAQFAASLAALTKLLEEFSCHHWALTERAAMSTVCTPIALRLIEREGADKWRTLEGLAEICWRKSTAW